ncbi:MAG TPA: GspMb/PilO family protein [Candidatus Aminicenantes bacterium]|nr:GspMb/PilO family protein [Candidatus Aminicenantes bacterium]
MNALFDLLDDGERRTLGRLGLAALVLLAVFLVLLVRVRGGLVRDRKLVMRSQEAALKAGQARDEARVRWRLWEDAGRDLAELRAGYFYETQESGQALRDDLQKVFAQAGTVITDLAYSYSDLEKEQVRKTVVTFTYTGTYAGLRRLLAVLEAFPKFLVIENIDFPRTGSGGERLSAKFTLAGYYGV